MTKGLFLMVTSFLFSQSGFAVEHFPGEALQVNQKSQYYVGLLHDEVEKAVKANEEPNSLIKQIINQAIADDLRPADLMATAQQLNLITPNPEGTMMANVLIDAMTQTEL